MRIEIPHMFWGISVLEHFKSNELCLVGWSAREQPLLKFEDGLWRTTSFGTSHTNCQNYVKLSNKLCELLKTQKHFVYFNINN